MAPLGPIPMNVPMEVTMNRPFVSLCPEITRSDAQTLMDWLEDERVTRHLSDSRHVR